MNQTTRDLALELTEVEEAILRAPLYTDPTDPTAGFSTELLELAALEERVIAKLISSARETP